MPVLSFRSGLLEPYFGTAQPLWYKVGSCALVVTSLIGGYFGFEVVRQMPLAAASPGHWLSFKISAAILALAALISSTFVIVGMVLRFASHAFHKG